MTTIFASIALGLAAILNVVATSMLARSDFESRFQKSAQMILTWLVPFVGAILVIAVLSQSNAYLKPFTNSDANANSVSGIGGPESSRDSDHQSHWGDSGYGGHGGDGGHGGP